MLKGLVAKVLNNCLGKYVENLNTDQLSIALLSGEVELENLPLRKDALQRLGLPIQIRCGMIGKVKLQIPAIRNIRSAPWIIKIEELYVVTGPTKLSEWESKTEKMILNELKQAALLESEAQWRAEMDSAQQGGYCATSYSSWLTYASSLTTNIVENLQLQINDVHIRYEDNITVPSRAFACGLTIQSLSAQSCDSNWLPTFTTWDTSTASFKLVELTSFSIYWDNITPPGDLFENLSMSDLAKQMLKSISNDHNYLLEPVTAQARIKRDRSEQPLRSRSKPRITCDLSLDEVKLTLTYSQYEQMIACQRGLDELSRLKRYRASRPTCPIKGNARDWWLYAIRCMMGGSSHNFRIPSMCLPPVTWLTCQQKAKDNVKYVKICEEYFANPNVALSAASKQLKEFVEDDRSLDDLFALRKIATDRVKPTPTSVSPDEPMDTGRSMLVQWFPQWWGRYETSESTVPTVLNEQETNSNSSTSELEDEILDVLADSFENNTLLKRDMVFGLFNFALKHGNFTVCLTSEKTTERIALVDLEYKNVTAKFETRPRLSSYQFELCLGELHLRDHLTKNTQFPVLISSSQQLQGYACDNMSKTKLLNPQLGMRGSPMNSAGGTNSASSGDSAASKPLFHLVYEGNPLNSPNVDYRLNVRSQSLDIVYNPLVLQWLSTFFTTPLRRRIMPTSTKLRNGLRRNWEQIIESDVALQKSWDIKLDISAPQIILVEEFTSRNAAVMLVDFGRLLLRNASSCIQNDITSSINQASNDSDDEDNFMTPCSTPPGSHASFSEPSTVMNEPTSPTSPIVPQLKLSQNNADDEYKIQNLTEMNLRERIYDRYKVELNDLQILLGKVRDNWNYAHTRGNSAMHVLDRFNIEVQIERRLIYTCDPSYPSVTATAILPKLTVHINEQKIMTMRKLHDVVMSRAQGLAPGDGSFPSLFGDLNEKHDDRKCDGNSTDGNVDGGDLEKMEKTKAVDNDNPELSRVVVLQFTIDKMELEVQSRGRSIAELQVTGVNITYTEREAEINILLSVHGLLLADALQTFGRDFELLVASHKHVGMDTISGSIRDSEPCSPTSPGSPESNRCTLTSPSAIMQALIGVYSNEKNENIPEPPSTAKSIKSPGTSVGIARNKGSLVGLEQLDADALITIEISIHRNCDVPTQLANIQFNNLDIIANQETIVELTGFVTRAFPQLQASTNKSKTYQMTKENGDIVDENPGNNEDIQNTPNNTNDDNTNCDSFNAHMIDEVDYNVDDVDNVSLSTRTEINFDFHRLNVLLLRAACENGKSYGKKVATATMSGARIQAIIDNSILIEGSLGGLQVLDLTPEGHKHQRIVSVGKDPLVEKTDQTRAAPDDLTVTLNTAYGKSRSNSFFDTDNPTIVERAFSFSIMRRCDDEAEIKVRMASVWYVHSPQFLMELQSCASEFKQYLTNLARSIKSAATDMAIGIVHARAEALAQSLYINSHISSSLHGVGVGDVISPRKTRRTYSQCSELDVNAERSSKNTNPQTPYSPVDRQLTINLKLDIVLDTPVVVLPRAADSPQVFVAHLGKIIVNNDETNEKNEPEKSTDHNLTDQFVDHFVKTEYYNVTVKDMNLYSLDTTRSNGDTTGKDPNLGCLNRIEELYPCGKSGKAILHDTMIQLTVKRTVEKSFYLNDLDLSDDDDDLPGNCLLNTAIEIHADVIKSLKLSMTRAQYEQSLDTFQTFLSTFQTTTNDSPNQLTRPQILPTLGEVNEEDVTGVATLQMDSHVRAQLFSSVNTSLNDDVDRVDQTNFLNMKVLFNIPEITLSLRGDIGSGEQSLVKISFCDFNIEYEKCHLYKTNVEVSLRSFRMEDLSIPSDSKHRYMAVSSAPSDCAYLREYLSRSCPNLTKGTPHSYMSSYPISESRSPGSLPHDLDLNINSSRATNVKPRVEAPKNKFCPETPPPSPKSERDRPQENLVLISSLIVDPSAPNFDGTFKSLNRSTTVDFNSLDLVMSVGSWVVVLDFFGLDSNENVETVEKPTSEQIISDKTKDQPFNGNSELIVKVRSLTVVLTRPDREVAKANISRLNVKIENKLQHASHSEKQQQVTGSLGSVSLFDLTQHGQLYKERFMTKGHQALNFEYLRLNDHDAAVNFNAQLSLEMSSVYYVHTKRFVKEIQSFFAHFSQLQTFVSSIRMAATNGGKVVKRTSQPYKLSFNLDAGAPVIFLPVSARSAELLVAHLGKLKVNNDFKIAGSIETISSLKNSITESSCLLNVMWVELVNMDLFTAKRLSFDEPVATDFDLGGYQVVKNGDSLLKEKCQLKVQVEKNLSYENSHDVPDMSIHGVLSTLSAKLNLDQYKLIRGLFWYNLGENDSDLMVGSMRNQLTDVTGQYDPLICESPSEIWRTFSVLFDLNNVTVELSFDTTNQTPAFAQINFIKSKFTYEAFNDSTEDIDLVSQEIQLIDTRYNVEPVNKRLNVFTNILKPLHEIQHEDSVQLEIHSRKRHDHSKFTILLNNMRLMAILDWWESIKNFLMEPPDPVQMPAHANNAINTPAQTPEIPYELKLNVTDSEIVIVENAAQKDTSAVIFKSTTVISYRPFCHDKPLSCNLNNCELFSCVLELEDESALSIIDPVTVNIEINNQNLDLQLQHLCVRVSYHDVMMFRQIMDSLRNRTSWSKSQKPCPPANVKHQLSQLTAMGFDVDDCQIALEQCNGQIDDAALWLTQNATVTSTSRVKYLQDKYSFTINAVEMKASSVTLCIIDDCRDADVPLLELSFAKLHIRQLVHVDDPEPNVIFLSNFETSLKNGDGWLECSLTGDYYNRVLSGWEPFIEPWKCEIGWQYKCTSTSMQKNRLQIHVKSEHDLNVNITSTFCQLYTHVRDTWIQDYNDLTPKDRDFYRDKDMDRVDVKYSPCEFRRRSPFIPYAIKNDTGSMLAFYTSVITLDKISGRDKRRVTSQVRNANEDVWRVVLPNDTVAFTFEERGKMRHRDTHKLRIHQMVIRIDGWEQVNHVSVDKVGTYFRCIHPNINTHHKRAWLVFDVALEGSARKLVTVRSSLIVHNDLPVTVELKLVSSTNRATAKKMLLESKCKLSVPLTYVNSDIFVKPISSTTTYMFCQEPMNWSHIVTSGESAQELRECTGLRNDLYRFCVYVRRENYPMDRGHPALPGHTLILRPAIQLINLLPYELCYNANGIAKGRIPAGGDNSIHQIDLNDELNLSIHLESFHGAGTLKVAAQTTNYTSKFKTRVKVEDSAQRRLFLDVNVSVMRFQGLEITISVPYWISNKTGIPLVFRQEGVAGESAGQYQDHEIGRMMLPLLFSLSDADASPMVSARVGNGVVPDATPQWSDSFSLHPSVAVRKLRVEHRDRDRPDTIYLIGVDVRQGPSRYRDTNIITLTPRYQLHNKSSYQLQFAQKCFATTFRNPGADTTYLKTTSNCHLPFHWPRLDQAQLLCVRILDVPDCYWSGGLKIDGNYSVHVNVRDSKKTMYFLRMDVILQGAIYFIIFTDGDTMPPPIRVDNCSEVNLTFVQTCVKNHYTSTARAHSSVPYAWDEPFLPSNLTIEGPGGVTVECTMNDTEPEQLLTYENFIYIAFEGTFKLSPTTSHATVDSQQLVLDVDRDKRVVLSRKQPGQRSQFWRMTREGQLEHEGSSPPCTSMQIQQDRSLIMVLDIETMATQPSSFTPLVVTRPNQRRRSTQKWEFTKDGRLVCMHKNLCVQPKDGFFGLRAGNPIGLALTTSTQAQHYLTEKGIPIEQAICPQRFRAGSGVLKLKVTTDGPTKVLEIYDFKEKNRRSLSARSESTLPYAMDMKEYQVKFSLRGIGVSIVSSQPAEELLYAYFTRIIMDMNLTNRTKRFNASVEDVQVDNQLHEAFCTSLIHVTRSFENAYNRNLPAVHVTAEMQTSSNENAVIFKHLVVTWEPINIYIEEILILKLFAFIGYDEPEPNAIEIDGTDFEMKRLLTEMTLTNDKKYYFGTIKIEPKPPVQLSMYTAPKLPRQLQRIKRKLHFHTINFENVELELKAFVKEHPFGSRQFMIDSIRNHFTSQLRGYIAHILGAADFLGNPIGLVKEVSEGVIGAVREREVKTMAKKVTHAFSNTIVKFSETLSDGLGKVVMDEEHDDARLRIRQNHADLGSGEQLLAGVKGLGFGVLGGLTGIFRQVYLGGAQDGVQGVVSGLGKGMVGVVAKPTIGLIDLVAGTSRAIRDSSHSRTIPVRCRPPRCVVGPRGLMPTFSKPQAIGQQQLYILNERNYGEVFVAYELLRGAPEDLRIVVSSEYVRIVTGSMNKVKEFHLSEIIKCIVKNEGSKTQIDLVTQTSPRGPPFDTTDGTKRIGVVCDSESLAYWTVEQIRYAITLYEEKLQTLTGE